MCSVVEHDDLVRHGSLLRLIWTLLPALFDLEWRAGDWSAAEAYAMEVKAIFEDAQRASPRTKHLLRPHSPHVTRAEWTRRETLPRKGCASPTGNRTRPR